MFEDAELGHTIDKATYDAEVPALRTALLVAQYALLERPRFSVLVLIGGVDGAGKGETVNTLNTWMDPRHISTVGFSAPSDDERARPPLWRYWLHLPAKGQMGIFFGSWYTAPISECVEHRRGSQRWTRFDGRLDEVARFEDMLVQEDVVLVKLWFHLSKRAQRHRLKTLARNPETAWRTTPLDWKRYKRYDDFREVSERALRRTSVGAAPWLIVEGSDERYRNLVVGRALLGAMQGRLTDAAAPPRSSSLPASAPDIDGRTVLRALDMTKQLSPRRYGTQLEKWQGRLNLLSRHPRMAQHAAVVVFEGMDAAGKGSAIRRITAALDARFVRTVPIAAPTDEERAHPYLWRFWRHVPRLGHLTLYDRSWYGRVLVERVEKFAEPVDWQRAYGEINDFEEGLTRNGVVVVKCWMAISRAEQLVRFKLREATGFKHYKITPEDYRNRKRWGAYETAVCDMIERTSTTVAPWHLVAANDKRWARIHVLKTLTASLEAALDP